MTRDFYPRSITGFSRTVMNGIHAIDKKTRGVSLLGGWAVFQLVDDVHAMPSQDIDVVVHNAEAWSEIEPWLLSQKYAWRRTTRGERDNCFVHDLEDHMRVDFFFGKHIPDEIPQRLFNTRWMHTIKDFPYEGFVPSAGTVLFDKFETLPKRDVEEKALKDALDAGNLLFYNKDGTPPKALMTQAVRSAARGALSRMKKLHEAHKTKYDTELSDLIALVERSTH